MSSLARKLKRAQDKLSQEGQLTEAQKRLPVGRVTTAPVKGQFTALPLLGWVSIRDQERIPLVMLSVALLSKEAQIKGLLQLEYPLYLETESATVAVLQRYGWRGERWRPGNERWPTGDEANEAQIRQLLENAGLAATLTFPPDAETASQATQIVEVSRARGPFLMPPLETPEIDPPEALTASLRALVKDFRAFYLEAPDEPEKAPGAENPETTTACLNCGLPGFAREDKVTLCDACFELARGKERGVAYAPPEADE